MSLTKKSLRIGELLVQKGVVSPDQVRIALTETGQDVHRIVAGLYDKHVRTVEQIGGIKADEFTRLNEALTRLERFWTDQIRFKL